MPGKSTTYTCPLAYCGKVYLFECILSATCRDHSACYFLLACFSTSTLTSKICPFRHVCPLALSPFPLAISWGDQLRLILVTVVLRNYIFYRPLNTFLDDRQALQRMCTYDIVTWVRYSPIFKLPCDRSPNLWHWQEHSMIQFESSEASISQ